MAYKTGFYRLADPATSFEIQQGGGEFVRGAAPVSLPLSDRVKAAIRIGLLIPAPESGETVAGSHPAVFIPQSPDDTNSISEEKPPKKSGSGGN